MIKTDLILVLTTESNLDNAKKLAKAILDSKLAACINFTEVNSFYLWENKLEKTSEVQLIIKTTLGLEEQLLKFIRSIHSYSLPELISIKASSGSKYMEWIEGVVN